MEYLEDWLSKRKADFTGAVAGLDLPKGILLLEELVSTGLLSTVMV